MDWVYVCASKYLIFNFVGSELAESALGVADLPAWIILDAASAIFLSF